MANFIFEVYLFCERWAIILYMLLRKLRERAMSQLLLEGHPWCRVPTKNPRHRQRPHLGAFIFGIPVTFGVLSPAPGNASVGVSIDVVGLVFRPCRRAWAPWDPASSSTGTCEDDGGGILPSRPGCGARRDEGGGGIRRIRRLALGANKPAEGARHPSTSHLALLFTTLRTLASGVVFRVDSVDIIAFAFQLDGVVVVAATFARASATGSVFLRVYEVVGIRGEGNEAEDLPDATYPSPLRQPFFVSVARVSHWPLLASWCCHQCWTRGHWAHVTIFTATRLVGWYMWGGGEWGRWTPAAGITVGIVREWRVVRRWRRVLVHRRYMEARC